MDGRHQLLPRQAGIPPRNADGRAAEISSHGQPRAVLFRAGPGRCDRARVRRHDRPALANPLDGTGARGRRRHPVARHARWCLSPARGLRGRLRRRPEQLARSHGPATGGQSVRGHLHHRGHPHGKRLPDRATRLVRPADQSGFDHSDAQATGRHLARRLPVARRRGSGGSGQAGKRAAARQGTPGLDRRACALGAGVDLVLQGELPDS